jgi:hypothetical protein
MRRRYLPVVALLAASCHDSTSPGPISDLNAIQVSTRVEPATVVAGATANVVLTLRNTAARPVEISACPIYFWVQGADEQIVGGSKLLYCIDGTFVYLPLRLKPLETKTLPFTWLVGETQVVPPGRYDVFGWVNDPAHRSAPVPITVQTAN